MAFSIFTATTYGGVAPQVDCTSAELDLDKEQKLSVPNIGVYHFIVT